MSMSKKDFVALAQELRDVMPQANPQDLVETARNQLRHEAWMSCVRAVVHVCERANPAFDRDRFYEASGVYEPFISQEGK